MPASDVTSVRVLRQFHGGADGQVFMGVMARAAALHLVVVKRRFDERVCELEEQRWSLFNCRVQRQTLFKRKCLVMPFVLHVVTSHTSESVMGFKSDLEAWGREPAVAGTRGETQFTRWTLDANELLSGWNPERVLRAAVAAVANEKYVNLDLEWRHVALLPVVQNDRISDLKPMLIDLARMDRCESADIARAAMNSKVEELIQQLTAN